MPSLSIKVLARATRKKIGCKKNRLKFFRKSVFPLPFRPGLHRPETGFLYRHYLHHLFFGLADVEEDKKNFLTVGEACVVGLKTVNIQKIKALVIVDEVFVIFLAPTSDFLVVKYLTIKFFAANIDVRKLHFQCLDFLLQIFDLLVAVVGVCALQLVDFLIVIVDSALRF